MPSPFFFFVLFDNFLVIRSSVMDEKAKEPGEGMISLEQGGDKAFE